MESMTFLSPSIFTVSTACSTRRGMESLGPLIHLHRHLAPLKTKRLFLLAFFLLVYLLFLFLLLALHPLLYLLLLFLLLMLLVLVFLLLLLFLFLLLRLLSQRRIMRWLMHTPVSHNISSNRHPLQSTYLLRILSSQLYPQLSLLPVKRNKAMSPAPT